MMLKQMPFLCTGPPPSSQSTHLSRDIFDKSGKYKLQYLVYLMIFTVPTILSASEGCFVFTTCFFPYFFQKTIDGVLEMCTSQYVKFPRFPILKAL